MSKVTLHYSAAFELPVNSDVESVLSDDTADDDEKTRTIFYSYQKDPYPRPYLQVIEAAVTDDGGRQVYYGIVHDRED